MIRLHTDGRACPSYRKAALLIGIIKSNMYAVGCLKIYAHLFLCRINAIFMFQGKGEMTTFWLLGEKQLVSNGWVGLLRQSIKCNEKRFLMTLFKKGKNKLYKVFGTFQLFAVQIFIKFVGYIFFLLESFSWHYRLCQWVS